MRLALVAIAAAIINVTFVSQATAQKTIAKPGQTISVTATIERIDAARRFVVLRNEDESEVGVFAPEEFARFNELRVGDTVTITYYDSVVYRLRRPGAPRPRVSEEVAAIESKSPLPGATFSHQITETVTVEAVNVDTSTITVTGLDGRTASRHVDDASELAGVKPGDHIDITYTEALLATGTNSF